MTPASSRLRFERRRRMKCAPGGAINQCGAPAISICVTHRFQLPAMVRSCVSSIGNGFIARMPSLEKPS